MLPDTLLFRQAVCLPGSGAFKGLEGAQAFQEGVHCLSSFSATTVPHGHGPRRPLLSTELRDELSHKQPSKLRFHATKSGAGPGNHGQAT